MKRLLVGVRVTESHPSPSACGGRHFPKVAMDLRIIRIRSQRTPRWTRSRCARSGGSWPCSNLLGRLSSADLSRPHPLPLVTFSSGHLPAAAV